MRQITDPLFSRINSRISKNHRKQFCTLVRDLHIPLGDSYKKLRFTGEFKVKLGNRSFKMMNNGGIIENETFWKGLFQSWETETGWLWKELSAVSNVILDVGANTGIYSLSAFSINPQAKIYAFEPSVHTFKILKQNVSSNNFSINCEQLAISNKTNQQIFYDSPYSNQTGASLSPEMMQNNTTIDYIVNTTTLKDYIKLNKMQSIDLIKLDIELHEAEAVEGLGGYLNKFKPIIILEMLTQQVADKLSNYFDLNEFNLFHLGVSRVEQMDNFKIVRESLSRGDWNYLIFHKSLEEKIKENTSLYSKLFK